MNKIVIISSCGNCPFFDNEYWDYSERCIKLDTRINNDGFGAYPIPENCPLETTELPKTD